ncbi:MAG TPA: hypothetical protein VGS12_16145 [Caulobacteraceae bacterium]|nr:hypothetical protein [Caulobacteraceae bacterium]
MRKKEPAVCLRDFRAAIDGIRAYLREITGGGLTIDTVIRSYQYALLFADREFESFILEICISKINRKPKQFYSSVGVEFAKHLTAEQCEFLLIGEGYLNLRGHQDLVKVVSKVAGQNSTMATAVKGSERKQLIEVLLGLRNYIAHDSTPSHRAALRAMKLWDPARQRLGSAGYWLKARHAGQCRIDRIFRELDSLCEAIANAV